MPAPTVEPSTKPNPDVKPAPGVSPTPQTPPERQPIRRDDPNETPQKQPHRTCPLDLAQAKLPPLD